VLIRNFPDSTTTAMFTDCFLFSIMLRILSATETKERLHGMASYCCFLNIDLVRGSSGKRPEKGKKSFLFSGSPQPLRDRPTSRECGIGGVVGVLAWPFSRLLGRSERF
jgi:hypothetical protein